ncbi:MAG: hypothetical protein CVU84_09300 [Firmicutes bacterium HGW-Firmicutes-1]|jgi:hypothetical protein|nr:MAG: hypothetical protein CVU84_09300 [Firmicutes bacterium HGW-Firmicutes-1]
MKKLIYRPLTLVLCLLIVFSAIVPIFGATPVNDYASHWASETIKSSLESGITKGYPDGSFKPDEAITRAEFFSLVNNAFNYTSASMTTYTDVARNSWYVPVIEKAQTAGYIIGYPNGSIRPEGNISRQEGAVIIKRLKSLTAISNTLYFTDASSIALWSKQAVIAATEANIMIGYPDGSFKPNAPISRAEALVAVHTSLNLEIIAVTETDPDVIVGVQN